MMTTGVSAAPIDRVSRAPVWKRRIVKEIMRERNRQIINKTVRERAKNKNVGPRTIWF